MTGPFPPRQLLYDETHDGGYDPQSANSSIPQKNRYPSQNNTSVTHLAHPRPRCNQVSAEDLHCNNLSLSTSWKLLLHMRIYYTLHHTIHTHIIISVHSSQFTSLHQQSVFFFRDLPLTDWSKKWSISTFGVEVSHFVYMAVSHFVYMACSARVVHGRIVGGGVPCYWARPLALY